MEIMPKKPFVPNVVDVASAATCPRIPLLKLIYGASGEYTGGLAIGTVTHSVLAELGQIESEITEKVSRAGNIEEISNQIYTLWLKEAGNKIDESWRIFADARISAQEGREAVLDKLRGFSKHLAKEIKQGYTRPGEIISGHHLIDLDLPLEGVPDEYRIFRDPLRIEIREFKSYGGTKINETNKLQACAYQLLLERLYPNASFSIRVYSIDSVANVRMTTSRRKRLRDGINTILQVYDQAYGPAKPIPQICAVCSVNHACNYYFSDTQPPHIRKYFWKLRMQTLEEKGLNQSWKWKSKRLPDHTRIELGITDSGYKIIKTEPKRILLAKNSRQNILPGETVIVSAGNPLVTLGFTGEVAELTDTTVTVVPYADVPVNLPQEELSIHRYDVDLTRRQLRSIDAVHRAKGRTAELTNRLLGVDLPRTPDELREIEYITALNSNQQEAVKVALNAPDFAIILGPPGTGKTLVIVEILAQLARDGKRALVVSITNPAVDNIVERLLAGGHKFGVRFGNWYKIRESAMQVALINILSNEKDMAIAAVEKMRNAVAVLTTCSSASLDLVKAGHFDVVIFEEASQIRMQDAFAAISQADKMVIIGDDKQLPPVSQMNKPISSLLEIAQSSLTRNNLHSQLIRDLKLQYRMRREICDLIDLSFYGHKLDTATSVHERSRLYAKIDTTKPAQLNSVLEPNVAIGVVDVEGVEEYRGTSTYNLANLEIDLRLLDALKSAGVNDNQIGLITPYKEQQRVLTKAIGRGNIVGTVDSFQGQERDIIILDLVRANPNHEAGFTLQPKRLNVALSRAREKLIIVANLETLQGLDEIINRINTLPNTRIVHVNANELGIKLPTYTKRTEMRLVADLTDLEEPQDQPKTQIAPSSGYFDIY
jgi:superfamily I DNA and/or RNA helicase